jgi:hypothetical protein
MTTKALEQFASAIGEYAQHLASHTDAVKGMASASLELREAVREQNRMFSSWRGIVPGEQAETRTGRRVIPGCYREKHLVPSEEYKTLPVGCYNRFKLTPPHQ